MKGKTFVSAVLVVVFAALVSSGRVLDGTPKGNSNTVVKQEPHDGPGPICLPNECVF